MSKIGRAGFAVFGILLCVVALGAFVVMSVIQKDSGDALDWGIMIDSGSTHSQAYIFFWDHRENVSIPLVRQSRVSLQGSDVTTKSISSFLADPTMAGSSLQSILDYCLLNIPEAAHGRTVIHLGATAGMREAILKNASSAEIIMESVRDTIASYPFRFEREWARVINGTEEGVFGWLSVNYLSNNLQSIAGPEGTVAAFDLGGASTQITFSTDMLPESDGVTVCAYENCFNLYAHSYLGFGLSLIRDTYVSRITNGAPANVTDPCLPLGVSDQIENSTFYVVGSSDANGCLQAITPLLNKNVCGTQKACGVNGTYQPPVPANMTLKAFSGFVYPIAAMSAKPVFNISTDPTLAEISTAQKILCALDLSGVSDNFPDKIKYTAEYCFTTSYMINLLGTGYNLPLDQPISFLNTLHDVDIGWALGAIIKIENLIPITPLSNSHIIEPPASYALIAVASVAVVGSVLCVMFGWKRLKSEGGDALPMHTSLISREPTAQKI